ncbi:ribonuclease H-like domain-containing protein, partial [Tanacetum coccineum]
YVNGRRNPRSVGDGGRGWVGGLLLGGGWWWPMAIEVVCKLDVSYPLHLHPNDSSTLTVVSIKLKGTRNYNVWPYAMLLALEGRNNTWFIDNTCRRSNTDEVLGRQWDRVNVVVLSSTSSFLDDQISKLMSLIKENTVNSNGKVVHANMSVATGLIVDSGANQHLTYTDKDLLNVIDISKLGLKVSHLNGTKAFINKVGNMILNENLTLGIAFDVVTDTSSNVPNETGQDLNHTNFFDEVVCEVHDIPNDEMRENDSLNSGGSNSFPFGSPTNDHNDNEGEDYYGSNVSVNESEMAATLEDNYNEFVVDSKVKFGLEKIVNYSKLSSENKCFVTELKENLEAKSFWQACKDQHWIEAIKNEMDVLYRNDTWELIGLPKDRKAIGSKWVYKVKYKSNGEIKGYKARLVAKRYNQKQRIDFYETFYAVVKIVTDRCLINLVVPDNLSFCHLDINNAFLYGDLTKTNFMPLPKGYLNSDTKRVCRLKKSRYRLKHAPR